MTEIDPRRRTGGGFFNNQLSDEENRTRKGYDFFGFEFRKHKDKSDKEQAVSFVPPLEENENAQIIIAGGGFYGQILDTRGDNFANDRDLILKYRNISMNPEVDRAIEDIANEVVVTNEFDMPIRIVLDDIEELSDSMKERITEEFDYILKLLDFRKFGHDIFKRWYIDGRINYHIVINMKNPKKGIIELRPINPLKIQKVKEIQETRDSRTGIVLIGDAEEYFVYSDVGFAQGNSVTNNPTNTITNSGLKIPKDSIINVTSGLLDTTRKSSLSFLHKSLRNVNQLRMMEDAIIIYRLARAPERRIFYVDTGDLPYAQATKYIEGLVQKYRNKLVYDATTGQVTSNKKHMHMLEDFWLPRSSTGKGTEVSTLPGGTNFDSIPELEYFQRKLYQALNVPIGRLDPDAGFNIGRSNEITREEVRFQYFIDKMRQRFAELFIQGLKAQLILKGILKETEWEKIKENITFNYTKDNFFSELKDAEIMQARLELAGNVTDLVGIYYSKEYVRKKILMQTDEEIEEIKNQIRKETISNDALPNLDDANKNAFDGSIAGPGGSPGDNMGGNDFDTPDLEGGGDGFNDNDFDFDTPDSTGAPEGAATSLGADDDLNNDDDDLNNDDLDNNNKKARKLDNNK